MINSRKMVLGLGFAASMVVANNQNVFNIFSRKEKKSEKTNVYIWGNGEYQARPDVGLQFKNFEPKKINQVNGKAQQEYNFSKVFFGEFHEAAIDQNGKGYVWKKKALQSFKEAANKDNERENVIQLKQDNVVKISFTQGYVWTLNKKGEVHSYPIDKKFNDYNEVIDTDLQDKPRKIKTLPSDIVQISTGEDHFLALTKNGSVYTMGDDTYGQCGVGQDQRSTAPPFNERRIKNPRLVENLPKIRKIVCGHNHNLAISESGQLYGWGSNQNVQLSNEDEFSKQDEPLIAVFQPIRLSNGLENITVKDVAAGENITIVVGENKQNGECEVFSCGYNINGQLGLGYLRHVSDFAKVEGLSNYSIKNQEGKEENITVKQIECGSNHCMALLNIGGIMEWGQNEYGQLGNRKRVFSDHPILMGRFKNDNVLNISCGWNQSAVISEFEAKLKKEDDKK